LIDCYRVLKSSESVTDWLPAILAFLIATSGWYYAWYSRAAEGLAHLESVRVNRFRQQLRRVGGCAMILLGAGIAVGTYGLDLDRPGMWFALIWIGVMLLLVGVIVLVYVDIRLTHRLWKNRSCSKSSDPPPRP
jgi:peptidoglycan/LPS O-acetylase OafA/YrhL